MIQDRQIDISEFIQLTSAGLVVANYSQIQSAIIRRYKDTYGDDIDVSSSTADGVFINNISLMVNNMLQAFKQMYANLDVNSASGVYLDRLCRLSNVKRKQATKSFAQLQISTTVSNQTLDNGTVFVDKAGINWIYNGDTITLTANTEYLVTVTCRRAGQIICPVGWIDKTLETSYLIVEQTSAGEIGSDIESDSSLRSRRSQTVGATGSIVKESLIGALLSLDNVDDAIVYDPGSESTANDGTTIEAHDVYIIVKLHNSTINMDDTIGQTIFKKMTPGILTTETSDTTSGVNKHYDFIPVVQGIEQSVFESSVYWKQAKSIKPKITIQFTATDVFDAGSNGISGTCLKISQAIIDYMNARHLGELPSSADLTIEAFYADPQFNGRPTYVVTSASINLTKNPDTYFDYSSATVTVTHTGKSYKIEIGG